MEDGYRYGYARVSTEDQEMRLQFDALIRHGVEENMIFSEHASGKTMNRKRLKDVLKLMRGGDTLVVWKLDRLGRTLTGVLETVEKLEKRGISLVSITENFDTTTPIGRAFMQIALVFAELERNMISERTKAAMAAGKAEGKVYGRKRHILDHPKRLAYLQKQYDQGKLIDGQGHLLMTREAVVEGLNNADRKALPIKNTATIKRWQDDGFPGLKRADKTEPQDAP